MANSPTLGGAHGLLSWSDDRLLRAFYAVSFVGSVVIACSIVLGPVFLAPAKNILHETELSQDTSKTIFASFLLCFYYRDDATLRCCRLLW